MSSKLPLADIISNLEARIAFHREQVAHHAQHAEHHLEQRASHEAELQTVTEHCEALKAAAPGADLVRAVVTPSRNQEPVAGPPPTVSGMVQEVVAAWPDAEPFGLTYVTKEVNQRFQAALKQPADLRTVSAALRRMLDHRRIRLVREGKPYYEALYMRVPQARLEDLIEQVVARAPADDITDADIDREVAAIRDAGRSA